MLYKTILSYHGPISFSTIDWLLSEFKIAAQDHNIPFRSYKKMLSIMIEALENITKYSDQARCSSKAVSEFCPACYINRNTDNIELVTRNPVMNRHVEPLRARIDQVNSHSRESLTDLYRSTITNGEFSEEGGAGLGLIEIAKTAGNKIEYDFKELSADYSLYTFRIHFPV
jgi:hypothetical protein